MTSERQVMMLVPCERHTDTVVSMLDQARVIDWVLLPTAQARRMGALEYRPPSHESSCNLILGVADELSVAGALHTVAQAVQEKERCPHCLVYVWEATQTLLTSVALDPVCRMAVDQEEALSATHEGRAYYFCSRDCRDQFLRGADAYLGKGDAAAGETP